MNVSRRTLAVLLILLVSFTAGTIWIKRDAEKETQLPQEVAYYLTAYESADDILAVVVENATGSLTIVHSSDTWFTDTALPGIEPDIQAVTDLFSTVSRMRTGGRVEGADPSDSQFGLASPAATILVEDTNEDGIQFLVGNKTPDEKAYYICAAGGSEVFTLSTDYGQAFLGDVTQYLDLCVLAGTDLSGVTSMTVSDPAGLRFSLTETGTGNITGMKYYSLTQPVQIPLAASLVREKILSPMEQMRAQTVSDKTDAVTAEDAVKALLLVSEDGMERTYLVGETRNGLADVTDITAGVTFRVPDEQLTWMDADELELLDGKLLSLNAGETDQIILEAQGNRVVFDLSGSGTLLTVKANGDDMPAADFSEKIFDPLNRISIQRKERDKMEKTEEVLRCTILTGKGGTKTELIFDGASDDRRCHVTVNGKEAFDCDRSSLQPLIEAAAGA